MFGRESDRLAGGSGNAEHALATRGPLVRDRIGFPRMRPAIVGDDRIPYAHVRYGLLRAIGQQDQSGASQALANAAWVAFYAWRLGFIGAEGGNPLPVFLLIAGKWTAERVGKVVPQPGFYI